MSRQLTVGTQIFDYPEEGDQNWGEDATGWAEAITDIVNTLAGAGSISETTADINDNVTTYADILGAIFDSTDVRSFQFIFAINRSDGVNFFNERGKIDGIFNGVAWDYSIETTGDSGVTFQVTAAGQIQYISSNIGGTYTGDIKFLATAISD